MAQFAVNAQRFDPYKNFKFRVKWDGRYVAGISKVSALKRTTEVVKHREGGDPSQQPQVAGPHRVRGRSRWSAASPTTPSSSNGPTRSGTSAPGLGAEVSLKDFRKDIIIEVYNEAGQLAIAYKVFRCWVSEYQALPDLDANANAVAIQHIKLENEGWERDVDGDRAGGAGAVAGSKRQRVSVPMTLAPAIAEDAARPLQGEVLIAAWERGSELPAALRALPLLAAGCGLDERQAAAMDVPRRDAALLAVRRCSFGDALHGFATCDACGERLEFALSVAEVVDDRQRSAARRNRAARRLVVRVPLRDDRRHRGGCARSRSRSWPRSAAGALRQCPGCERACDRFCRPAARRARRGGAAPRGDARDGGIGVALACAACGATQQVALDPTEFLWEEHGTPRGACWPTCTNSPGPMAGVRATSSNEPGASRGVSWAGGGRDRQSGPPRSARTGQAAGCRAAAALALCR